MDDIDLEQRDIISIWASRHDICHKLAMHRSCRSGYDLWVFKLRCREIMVMHGMRDVFWVVKPSAGESWETVESPGCARCWWQGAAWPSVCQRRSHDAGVHDRCALPAGNGVVMGHKIVANMSLLPWCWLMWHFCSACRRLGIAGSRLRYSAYAAG